MKLTIVSNVLFCLQNEKPIYYRIKSFDPVNNYKWSELVVDDYYLVIDCNVYEYHVDVPIIFWTTNVRNRYTQLSRLDDNDFLIALEDPKGDNDLLFNLHETDAFSGYVKTIGMDRYWVKCAYDNSWIGVWEYENVQEN